MFLNGQAITSRGPQGQAIDDDTFILLFNAHFEDRQFRLPRVNMGERWELELTTADPESRPAGLAYAARDQVDVIAHSITILKRRSEPASAPGDISAAAHSRLRVCGRRPAHPYLRDLGVSHLYLSPSLQARHGSTHGYDVIDPTACRRTSAARPFRELVAAPTRPAWGSCSTSCPTTWRPTSTIGSGPIPRCEGGSSTSTSRPGAGGASSTSTSWPASGRRTRRCSRRPIASCWGWWARDWSMHCESTTPTAARTRCRVLRAAARRGAVVWIEKILESGEALRDWPVTGTVGYEFLNDVCGVFVDPCAEERSMRCGSRCRARAAVRGGGARGQARAGRRAFHAEIERLARLVQRPELGHGCTARGDRLVPGLPLLRARAGWSTTPTAT